jgi:hypothetical protein
VTPTSRCRRAQGRWRHRNPPRQQNPPENAAAAPGVVPRRREFRRKQPDINCLQKSGVQVGLESAGGKIPAGGACLTGVGTAGTGWWGQPPDCPF